MKDLKKAAHFAQQHSATKTLIFDDSDKARMMFKLAFLTTIGRIYLFGFNNSSKSLSQIQTLNIAEKYNRNIVCGEGPKYWIDYPSLQISAGKLSKPEYAKVTIGNDKELLIQWGDPLEIIPPLRYTVYIMQYDHTSKTNHIWECTSKKGNDNEILPVLPEMAGHQIHNWMFFVSEDGKTKSDSVYLGICKM